MTTVAEMESWLSADEDEHLELKEARQQFDDIVERFGRGRGVKYILSRRFAEFLGDPAMYTRERGLDRATNKELLVRHIELQGTVGCTLSEIAQVLPQLTIAQVRTLLQELKQEQRVHPMGTTRAARWFPKSDTKN